MGIYSDATGATGYDLDVDLNGDGEPDGIWMDLGLDIVDMADGAREFEVKDLPLGGYEVSARAPGLNGIPEPVLLYTLKGREDLPGATYSYINLHLLPAGFVDGLPVGLQLIGNYFDEAGLLGAAQGADDVVLVTLGTGIGGGLVADRGRTPAAGAAHMRVGTFAALVLVS